jgi:hypothetical protein
LVVLVGAICVAAPARAADDARTVALLPLLGSGLALDELTSADAAIQREVDARYGARSLPAAVVRERLEDGAKRGLRCDRSLESCQAQLGIVCDTDLVLIASLTPVGGVGGFTLSLRLVDVAEAAQLAFATSTYPGLPSAPDVKKLIAKLDLPEARKAFLLVTGPSGAPVVVDGAARGSLPWPKPIELANGRHEVVVHTDPLFTTTTSLRRGERTDVAAPPAAVAARLPDDVAGPADPPPDGATPSTDAGPPPRMLAIGGGGALAALGGAAVLAGLIPWLNYAGGAESLAEHERLSRDDPEYLTEERVVSIQETRIQYDEGKAAWDTWAPIAVATGSAALVVGATILVVGVVALE